MDRNFLDYVLEVWGFSQLFREFIGSCVNMVNYTLVLNGSTFNSFILSRGLRQKDPFFSYLFILRSKLLSRIISKEEVQVNIHRIKVCRNALATSHLLYTDSLLIACQATD